jgi:hypothetical protein
LDLEPTCLYAKPIHDDVERPAAALIERTPEIFT